MTVAPAPRSGAGDLRFYRVLITAMAAALVAGFVVQLAMGRSSFGAPPVVHLHALVFMGWVAIVVAQAWLVAGGRTGLHRALGGLALAWLLAMLIVGPLVTVAAVQTGRVPFFFQPQYLLLADPAMLFGAAGLVIAAVALRKDRNWHPRLQIGARFGGEPAPVAQFPAHAGGGQPHNELAQLPPVLRPPAAAGTATGEARR